MIKKLLNKKIKSNFNNVSVYFILNGLNQAIPFFIIPILLLYISKENYGLLSSFNSFYDLILILIGGGSGVVIQQKFFKVNKIKFKEYFTNVYIYSFFTFILLLFLNYVLSSIVTYFFQIDLKIAILATFAATLCYYSNTYYQYLQLQKLTIKYGVLIIFQSILNFSFSIFFVIYGLDWIGRIFGITLGVLIIFIIINSILLKNGGLVEKKLINKKKIKEVSFEGFRILPHSIVTWLNRNADKLIILKFIGTGGLGIYAVGLSISRLISIVIASYNQGIKPFIFEKLAIEDYKYVVNIFYKVLALTFIMYLTLLFLKTTIFTYIIPKDYGSLNEIFDWVIIMACFQGLSKFFVNIIIFYEKTKEMSILSSIINLLGITSSLYFAINHGLLGVSISATIFSFILLISYVAVALKYTKLFR